MNLTITMDLDGAAMRDDTFTTALDYQEIAATVRRIAGRIEVFGPAALPPVRIPVRDVNGNTLGECVITDDDTLASEPRPAGHYHDPSGRYDYCDDPKCYILSGKIRR